MVKAPHPCEHSGMQVFLARSSLHARAQPHSRPGCHSSRPIRDRPAGGAAPLRPRSSARPRQRRCALSTSSAPTPPRVCCERVARPHPIHLCPCLLIARSPPACPNLPPLKRFCGAGCTGWPYYSSSAVRGRRYAAPNQSVVLSCGSSRNT